MLEEKLVIRKNYQKRNEINSTQYGKVYYGRNIIDDEPVIIEEFSANFDFNFQMKFLNRVEQLSKLDNIAIVDFIGFCLPEQIDQVYYPPIVIFRYTSNLNLENLILQRSLTNGVHIMKILYGVASGLRYLNDNGTSHGNLDLQKVLVNQDWEPVISEIRGFADDAGKNFSIFKAPEILTNNALEADEKVDVYSFSFIVYSIFCGVSMLQLSAADVINGQRPPMPPIVPVQYQELIKACWDQNPAKRPKFDEIISNLSSSRFDLSNNDPSFKDYQIRFCNSDEINSYLRQGQCYFCGLGVEKNDKKAAKFFKKAAKLGNRCGQFRYGFCLLYGKGVFTDFEKAVTYLRKSAEQDYCHAQFYLGICYKYGYGVVKNLSVAFDLFQKAASGIERNYEAMVYLGKAYMKGEGVQTDQVKAARCYYDAVQEGIPKAQRLFGICWINGIGVEPNVKAGEDLIRKAAQNGDKKAQYYFMPDTNKTPDKQPIYPLNEQHSSNNFENQVDYPSSSSNNVLSNNPSQSVQNENSISVPPSSQNTEKQNDQSSSGPNVELKIEKLISAAESGDPVAQCKYGRRLLYGDGVSQDLIIGFEYLKMSSARGNSDAWVALGTCFKDGYGVKKDIKHAAYYYQKAANAGNPNGIELYGTFLDKGIGVKKNQKEALNQWEKLSKLNNATGLYMLGLYYKNGIEVKKNHVTAFKNFQAAANLDHYQACLEYGIYLENGKGTIEQDLNQALKMYEKAFNGGVQQAKDYINKIKKKLGKK